MSEKLPNFESLILTADTLELTDGSEILPSLRFSTDNTGLYLSATGILTITADATDVASFSSTTGLTATSLISLADIQGQSLLIEDKLKIFYNLGLDTSYIEHLSVTGKTSIKLSTDTAATSFSVQNNNAVDIINVSADGKVIISGNLDVYGTVTQITLQELTITDPLIKVADGYTGSSFDIGLVGLYNNLLTGIVFDATDQTWKLFSDAADINNTSMDFNTITYANLITNQYQTPFTTINDTGLYSTNNDIYTISSVNSINLKLGDDAGTYSMEVLNASNNIISGLNSLGHFYTTQIITGNMGADKLQVNSCSFSLQSQLTKLDLITNGISSGGMVVNLDTKAAELYGSIWSGTNAFVPVGSCVVLYADRCSTQTNNALSVFYWWVGTTPEVWIGSDFSSNLLDINYNSVFTAPCDGFYETVITGYRCGQGDGQCRMVVTRGVTVKYDRIMQSSYNHCSIFSNTHYFDARNGDTFEFYVLQNNSGGYSNVTSAVIMSTPTILIKVHPVFKQFDKVHP